MKCFGAKGQLSSSLFADGTAATSLHQAAGCTVGFHRESKALPCQQQAADCKSWTHPDCHYLLLPQVVPDLHQLRRWGVDFRGAVLICTGLWLEWGSANTCPRWAGSKVTQDHDVEGSGSA